MIQTVDNFTSSFFPESLDLTTGKGGGFSFGNKAKYSFHSSAKVDYDIDINLGEYLKNNGKVLSLSTTKDTKHDNDLILSISKGMDGKHIAKTENYVGKFTWDGLEVDIKSRFSDVFMMRMLNVVNDVFLDDASSFSAKESKNLDFSKFIIYYLFVQKLEKAFLLGLPKAYRSIQHHEMKLKGKIDINRFINHDIPFQGKISSVSREQKEIQEVIDVLHKAVTAIDKNGESLTKNITHIKTHLKQHKSSQYVSNATIQKALTSKALQNPIFAPYKSVLEYAKLVIDGSNLEEKTKGKDKTYGFLVNVAELFEIYITKLLQKEFPGWSVDSPSLKLDDDDFGNSYLYNRKIIPDIVMQDNESNKVMVFDTKYKRMTFHKNQHGSGDDIDRCDFFQINTYMNYYNNQSKHHLIAGGLLYPMEAKFDQALCHSDNWFGNSNVKFIVDGIDLVGLKDSDKDEPIFANIERREKAFINGLRRLLQTT